MASSKDLEGWEYTATWTVAVVCSVFVIVSLLLERGLHHLGKILLKKKQKPLNEALQKLKEELMLLGFISLLLTAFQWPISRVCLPENYTRHLLPCKWPETNEETAKAPSSEHESHSRKLLLFIGSASRQLLSSGGGETSGYCEEKGKKPFVSTKGLHQLHIFIFVLAIVHVLYCVFTMLLGCAKMRMWMAWEKDIVKNKYSTEDAMKKKINHVVHDDNVKTHAGGNWRKSAILSWVACFFKQFYGSMTKADYSTLRLCFIETHCKSNPQFNFYKYILRTLEADFKKVVGISGYLWFFVVLFLLLNVHGWHTYFWMAFLPLILLLSVGAKLEHVIGELAQEVAEIHAVEGLIPVRLSDKHFWFGKPELILYLIHFILFQNAFEIAFFFWILTTYGFDSCIMGSVGYIIPRLVIGVVIQVLCSFSTLPLYALVTQMGTRFKNTIFEEHIHEGLSTWHGRVKMKAKDKQKRLPTWRRKVRMKSKENQTNRPDADSVTEDVQMMRSNGNGTSPLQSETVHNESTEIAEAKIDMPRSSSIRRENQKSSSSSILG